MPNLNACIVGERSHYPIDAVAASMGDDSLEALECLKSWQRDGLVAATREDIKAMDEMLAALCEVDLQ